MTRLELFQPASAAEAIGLLRSSAPPIDSPTERRHRSDKHLEAAFKAGLRRPEWVFAARRGDRIVGAIAAAAPWVAGVPSVIDHISHPGVTAAEHADFTALAARAIDELCPLGCQHVGIYAPSDVGFDAPALAPLIVALHNCGWVPAKAGRHYEFEVRSGLGEGIPSELRLERLVAADDPRLLSVFPQMFTGSLDSHDIDATNRLGFDAAWRKTLEELLAADPVECVHLAFDSRERCVGLVSGRVMRGGAAYVLQVGVAEAFRGRGYGAQLLAAMTRELVSAGAKTLIADTDNQNQPMAKAFDLVGWVQTESHLDFTRGATEKMNGGPPPPAD